MSNLAIYKLGEIFDLQMGKTPARVNDEYWNTGDYKWVSIADLTGCEKYICNTKETISEKAIQECGMKCIPENTVIMSFKLSIGKTAITSEKIYTNEAIMAFISKGVVDIDPSYLYHMFSYRDWTGGTNRAVMGITLNKATLMNLEIALPPIEEQKKIAVILDKVSQLVSLRKKQIEKLDLLVKSQFIEMFGDPVTNPNGWETRKLQEICTKLNDGTHFSPENYPVGDFKYITAKNIKPDGFDFSNLTYVSADVHNEVYARCNPEYGDILYIKDGVTTGIAMVNALNEPFTLLSSVALLKHNRSIINGFYLRDVLNNENMYMNIRRNMGGAAITRLTIAKLKVIEIPIPRLELQNQFAAFVQQSDKSKFVMQQGLEKLELTYKSLMQQYFG